MSPELPLVAVLLVLVVVCIGIAVSLIKKSSPTTTKTATATAKPRSATRATNPPPALGVESESEPEAEITRVAPFDFKKAAAAPLPSLNDGDSDDDDPANESKSLIQFEDDCWLSANDQTGPHDLIATSAAGQTDRGVTRRRNEDAYLIDTKLNLYVVADGMGGYAGGDIASQKAVQEVRDSLKAPPMVTKDDPQVPRRGGELMAAIERANAVIHEVAKGDRRLEGMGTTVVAARFAPRKQRVYIGHVGDSRAYRLRNDDLRVLTSDHTLAALGVVGPLANNIRRAVGIKPNVKVDLIVDKPLPGDIYLFCSDGLTKMIDASQILNIVRQHDDLDRAASALIAAANAKGGRDNITVVLVRVDDVTKRGRGESERRRLAS